MFFWKRKTKEMPDDLKVIEERLCTHGKQTPGPSEEFQGRLESRLTIAWEHREWNKVATPRYFSFVPQFAVACTVVVLAFVSASVTVRGPRTQEYVDQGRQIPIEKKEIPVRNVVPQKFFSALTPSLKSIKKPDAVSDERVAPRGATYDSLAGTASLGMTTASMTSPPSSPSSAMFTFWFALYLFCFGVVWFIIRIVYHRLHA